MESIAVVRKRSYQGLDESAWIGVVPTVSGWIGVPGQTTRQSSTGSMVGPLDDRQVVCLGRPLDNRRVACLGRALDDRRVAWLGRPRTTRRSSSGLLGSTTRWLSSGLLGSSIGSMLGPFDVCRVGRWFVCSNGSTFVGRLKFSFRACFRMIGWFALILRTYLS